MAISKSILITATKLGSVLSEQNPVAKAVYAQQNVLKSVLNENQIAALLSSLVDTFSTSDRITNIVFTKGLSDSPVFRETTSLNFSKRISDTYSVQDIIVVIKGLSRTFTDTFRTADAKQLSITKVLQDLASTSDTLRKTFGKSLSDIVSTADTFNRTVSYIRQLTDRFSTNDSAAKSVSKRAADIFSLSDRLIRTTGRVLSDTLSENDRTALSVSKGISDVNSLSDILTRSVGFNRAFSDTFSELDFASKDTFKTVTETVSLTDLISISFLIFRNFTDAVSETDTTELIFAKNVFDIIEETDFNFKTLDKLVSDLSSSFEELSKDVSKSLVDEFSLTDIILISFLIERAFADETILQDFVSKDFDKAIINIATIVDETTKNLDKLNKDFSIFNDQADKTVSKDLFDEISLTDIVFVSFLLERSFDDTFSISDASVKDFDKAIIDLAAAGDDAIKTLDKNNFDISILVDQADKTVSKDLFDEISLTDELTAIILLVRDITDTFAEIDELSKTIDKILLDLPIIQDAAEKTVDKIFADIFQLSDLINIENSKVFIDFSTIESPGSLISQGYTVDNTYFAEDYVGDYRTFT